MEKGKFQCKRWIFQFGKEKGEIFFTKVYNVSKKEKQLNKDLIKSIGLKKLERELEKAKDEYSDYKNIPIDVVFVRLKKNKYPDIKHFRGIEFNWLLISLYHVK